MLTIIREWARSFDWKIVTPIVRPADRPADQLPQLVTVRVNGGQARRDKTLPARSDP
jgi:hypothetical protein